MKRNLHYVSAKYFAHMKNAPQSGAQSAILLLDSFHGPKLDISACAAGLKLNFGIVFVLFIADD